MHAGEVIGCFGLTEPDAGSDPGTMRTHARRDGVGLDPERHEDVDHERRRSPTSPSSGRAPRTARSAASSSRGEHRGSPLPEIHQKLSLRASVTSELVLDDVRVPADSMLPEANRPERAALVPQRGALRDRLRRRRGRRGPASRRHSPTRSPESSSRKPISAYQLTQQKLAEMALARSTRASLLALHIGRMKDAGTLRAEHVSLGKMGNVRGAIEVCRERADDSRGQRNHPGVPGHPAHEQPRVGAHVRGHPTRCTRSSSAPRSPAPRRSGRADTPGPVGMGRLTDPDGSCAAPPLGGDRREGARAPRHHAARLDPGRWTAEAVMAEAAVRVHARSTPCR